METPKRSLEDVRLPAGNVYEVDVASREIHLVDLLLVIAKNRRMILLSTMAAGVLVALGSLFMPNIYTASARIMPPQRGQTSAGAFVSQLGPLAGMAGVAVPEFGLKGSSAQYVGMLKSRTVADYVIGKLKLHAHYGTVGMSDTRRALAEASNISASATDGMISIDVDDPDPQAAADLANAYVEALQSLTSSLVLTEAAQRRVFFESRLEEAKTELAKAEIELKKVQERTGLIEPSGQAKLLLQSTATLRAMIVAKQVQLQSMKSFATSSNPDLIRAEEELGALRRQLAEMEKGGSGSDTRIPVGKVPAASLEFVQRFRDLKYSETLFEIISKQYEAAKMDESKNFGLPQVIDEAVRPDKKSRPKRLMLVLISMFVGGLVATAGAFMKESARAELQDPSKARVWKSVKRISMENPFRRAGNNIED